MKIKSNVEIDGVKYYSVAQIREMLVCYCATNLDLARSSFYDGCDDSCLRNASTFLSAYNEAKHLAITFKDYFC